MPQYPPTSAKGDPEAFELRGRPRPVVRFRRGVIIGTAAALAAALAGVAWLALDPPGPHLAVPDEGGALPVHGAIPDVLTGAPDSYGDVPQLGPPLPGDLGRPILEHRRSLEDEAQANGEMIVADDALAAAEAERRRAEAERVAAARTSPVMAQIAGRPGSGSGAIADGARAPLAPSMRRQAARRRRQH